MESPPLAEIGVIEHGTAEAGVVEQGTTEGEQMSEAEMVARQPNKHNTDP